MLLTEAAANAESRREQAHLGDRAREVVAFVSSRDSTRAIDLAAIGLDKEQARVYLNRLADGGRIQKVGRGLYKGSVTSVLSVTNTDEERANVTDVTNVTPLFGSASEVVVCGCGAPLVLDESIKSGQCMECYWSGGAAR